MILYLSQLFKRHSDKKRFFSPQELGRAGTKSQEPYPGLPHHNSDLLSIKIGGGGGETNT